MPTKVTIITKIVFLDQTLNLSIGTVIFELRQSFEKRSKFPKNGQIKMCSAKKDFRI